MVRSPSVEKSIAMVDPAANRAVAQVQKLKAAQKGLRYPMPLTTRRPSWINRVSTAWLREGSHSRKRKLLSTSPRETASRSTEPPAQ